MRTKSSLSLLLGLTAAVVLAQADSPPAPKGEEARIAKAKFEAALGKARQEHGRAVAAARKQYAQDLDAALKGAMNAEQLDEAVRIRDLKKAVEAGGPETPAAATPKAVSGREGAVNFRGSQHRIVLAQIRTWGEAREAWRKVGGTWRHSTRRRSGSSWSG